MKQLWTRSVNRLRNNEKEENSMSMYIENAELERELAAWRRSSDDPAQRIPSERLG